MFQLEMALGIEPIPGIDFKELSLRGMTGTIALVAYLLDHKPNGSARILTANEIDNAVRHISRFSHLKSWRRRLREIRELSIKRWGAKPDGRPVREIYEVKFTQRDNPQFRFLMSLGEIWSLVQEANHQPYGSGGENVNSIPQVTTEEQARQIINPDLEMKGSLIEKANNHIRIVWALAKKGCDMSAQQARIRVICGDSEGGK